jgi:sterol desaturase/sphingolipid hydroxylase (fatty acid hydroxylase superfamily)
MQGIPANAFLIIVAGIGAVIAIPGLIVLLAPGRAQEVFRRRWARSFAPQDPPAGGPTLRLVVITALIWFVVGGGLALLAILALLGVLAPPPGVNPDAFPAFLFGGVFLISGGLATIFRRQFHDALHTINRMLSGRPSWEEFLTPGTTLGISITIAAVGLLVVIYGFSVVGQVA